MNEELKKSFEEVGIKLTDENGNYRKFDEVINELAIAFKTKENAMGETFKSIFEKLSM